MNKYDVIVVGGGHAGVEACWVCAKKKLKVLLMTQTVDNIAQMSCNPSIGGLAKSHLVKELDILGGLMPTAADRSAIQFKILNRSKGPAVWALRTQNDKHKYSSFVRQQLESNKYIDIVQDEVVDLDIQNNAISGIIGKIFGSFKTKKLIICSGTFLNAKIHIGTEIIDSGRLGENSAKAVSIKLSKLFETGRLKTGTPPRIKGTTIDFSGMDIHGTDDKFIPFSFKSKKKYLRQVPCYITHTNLETHKLISENLHKTALFSGQIKGTGPRYCPSIEDKIYRFADKNEHRLFLEPESLESNEYYINGFSTSLPLEIQKRALHTVKGMENCHFVRPAYAIEYDYFPAYQLFATLETKKVSGLYFAGQINGTSGYEEAACQGLVAGLNAYNSLKGNDPFIPKRNECYIGVLIDDLITKDIREPYRMFTSLAEYRLELRHDNADERLINYAKMYNLLTKKELLFLENRLANIRQAYDLYPKIKVPTSLISNILKNNGKEQSFNDKTVKLDKLLKRPDLTFEELFLNNIFDINELRDFSEFELLQAAIQTKYEGYIARQKSLICRAKKNENIALPKNLNYSSFKGLKLEAIEKLNRIKPLTVGQASRVAGISPADISIIIINLKKQGLI